MLNDKFLHEILGKVLKVGNCLNAGNKMRGQSDGFEVDDLGKAFNIKSKEGQSIMNIICKGIFDADQSVDDPKAKKFATFA